MGVVWTFFLSSIIFSSFSLSLGDGPILTEILSQRAVKLKINQPTNQPSALAIGAGGGCLDIFSLNYHFSFLSPSLWETARYRLKYCLKGPLNPEKPNQIVTTFWIRLHNATRFAVSVNEDQGRLPTFYWLPKLHKKNI